jgi:hypothetical protein
MSAMPPIAAKDDERSKRYMLEKTIDQIEEDVLSYEVSDEAVEAAGTRAEISGAWTFVCTGVQCRA